MEFEPMLTPWEKSPLPKMSPEEDRTCDAVDSEPKHYQLSYSGPRSSHMNNIVLQQHPHHVTGKNENTDVHHSNKKIMSTMSVCN